MMKQNVFLLACVLGACLITGCTDEWIVEDTTGQNEGTPFVIYASSEQKPASRLTFDEDGLTMLWENGDQLVLVDVNDKIDPIYLTTELDEPSSTAVFKSESGVPAGTYYIRNCHSTKYDNYEDWMTIDLKKNSSAYYSPNYNEQYQLSLLNRLGKPAELYAGPITIEDGQTHIDIELKHILAMLKFNIINPVVESSYRIGMVCPETPFPTKVRIDNSAKPQYPIPHMRLNSKDIYRMENVSGYGAFILPVNLTGKKVYFYVTIYDSTANDEIVYEIIKDGKELKPGTSYTINLDLNLAHKISVKNWEISTAEQLRALAYTGMDLGTTYTITKDIDCKGEVLFPIAMDSYKIIDGQNHTLENITINWPYDYAGLLSYARANIQNLTLKNCTINGKNQVGALLATGNNIHVTNCHLSGTNYIKGTGDYVGGLIGNQEAYVHPNNCSVSKETTVEGVNIVGGIAGLAQEITNCKSAATVKGNSSVGGIVGQAREAITECSSTAKVEAKGNYAGGVAGGLRDYIDINKCSFTEGTVSGEDYVGGIIGGSGGGSLTAAIELCYSTGTVKGKAYVGGIAGSDCFINNCYSLGNIEGADKATTAGISGGNPRETTPQNCYFAGTLTNVGYGITGNGTVTTCLTTASALSNADTEEDAAYTNLTSIVDMVSHINSENAYSTSKTWEGFANECPLFLWQIPSISIGDEDDEVVAPPFEEEEW